MKTVARLLRVYFTGTPLLRGLSAFGAAAVLVGTGALLYFPPLLAQVAGPSSFSLVGEMFLMMLPVVGATALLFGGSLMPSMVSRLATSHYANVLPHARGKLLMSAFFMVVSLAALAGLISLAYYANMGYPLDAGFLRTLAGSFLTYSLLYLVLWLVSFSRNPLALLGGSLLIVFTLLLPLRFMNLTVPLRFAIVPAVVLWLLTACGLLFAPRLKRGLGRILGARQLRKSAALVTEHRGGDRIDLVLNTAQPWVLALGQIVSILVAAYFVQWSYGPFAIDIKAKVWLFYLTILSMLSGAAASFAASRSRALWLRAHWTRADLFARAEASFWRQNSYALGILLVTMAVVGTSIALPTRALAFGLATLTLSMVVSTYLGLTVTRSIGWMQTLLAIGSMLLLLATALYATDRSIDASTIVGLEALLAALALFLRYLARGRWLELDWMLCRPDSTTRTAGIAAAR